MEWFTTQNFIHRYTWDTFILFCKMMNEGKTLKEMSIVIGLSISQLSRYRDTMFEVRYIPKQGTQEYMKEYASMDKYRFEQKENTILKSVEGGK